MAAPSHNHNAVPQDTLITIKVSVNDSLKKLKLPLRDLGANVLPDKLRHLLAIKPEQTVIFERFSDSAGGYITLDTNNPQVFKTLVRAAKAKLKLRLKATVTPVEKEEEHGQEESDITEAGQKAMEPVIVRSPVYQSSPRDSTAFDRRSVGSGIFQFREARASQQTLVDTEEAPVPRPFTTNNKDFFNGLASHGDLAFRTREPATTVVGNHGHPWSVYCNECDKAMSDAHYHCSICDGGDYDLCEECVTTGKLCPGEGHWLIKRFIKEGKVISSSTERISPRRMNKSITIKDLLKKPVQVDVKESKKEMPGAFAEETKMLAEESQVATRTCNSCVVVLPEREFVTCIACDDFDLCISCHTSNKHGHHPAHGFKPATEDTVLPLAAETMLAPGRNVRHNAICDGCDKKIYGVRHKCLNCPDWDYCNDCVKEARHTHPRHRFAEILQPIPDQLQSPVRHFGIFCDGPLCGKKGEQSYVTGVRYKCAVCHDTDFCASCEAFPGNHHNRTHPLIKIKTPVRSMSITTENEDIRGNVRMMGDRRAESAQTSTATETTPVQQANAATQVQTIAEIKPTEVKVETQPIPVIKSEEKKAVVANVPNAIVPATLLNAHFVHDSIPDGMVLQPGARFTQIWTLKNPGPYTWPAGCSVRYVGGDNMLNVDNGHPASVTDIANATESNVVGREVQVGEEVAFKVVLKAPVRVGKSISYWRLKAADGTPFGHRLWCDVDIQTPVAPTLEPVKPAAPTFTSPFDAAQRANIMRMQAMRQQQAQQHAQQQMMRRQMEMMAKQQEKAFNAQVGAPPAYDSTENLTTRLAAMRAEQQKRRDQMMAQFNAQRELPSAQGINRMEMPNFFQNTHSTAGSSDEDKIRKEAAKQRVEHIKAKIMRTREERARLVEAQKQAAAEHTSAEETEKVKTMIEVKKIIEEASKAADADAEKAEEQEKVEEAMEGSQMVFPKLDKESPASSTYQSATSSSIKGKAAYVENEEGEVERSATPVAAIPAAPASEPTVSSPTEERFEESEDDFEVMSADGEVEESEDDGFLTDEEYDILDASDQETVASK
ncbi:hypothetical protein LTR36_009739 [Oleoguttula mirabilis]|uniref:ZZ-type domain-containing protein n=1 Tax=Oleoguttula mirabilis TaxID=1507867 RepID=A0AAV9J5C3_9PEZI|nr:hypothetical protein LTR36_009739 [Oleoguttula mirabilis]